jgi:hypothetical protein
MLLNSLKKFDVHKIGESIRKTEEEGPKEVQQVSEKDIGEAVQPTHQLEPKSKPQLIIKQESQP